MAPRLTTTRLAPLAACALLAACSDSDTGTGSTSLSMAPCVDKPTLDCGTMDVPLIHDSTDQRRVLVDVVVLPGMGDGPHEPLLLNPGGPGGSGTELVREFAARDALPAALRERYDVVGFDPRGIGASQRIDCDRFGLDDLDGYPLGREGLETLAVDSTAAADACFAEYGDVLQHLGSNAVVRDMEALRTLLDAPALHFIGYSYGTRLAALYLERYPESSGRIVLDGSLLPGGELAPLIVGQSAAQQRNLDALLTACGTTLADCDPNGLNATFVSRLEDIIDTDDELAIELFGTLLLESVESPDFGALAIPVLIDYARTGDLEPVVQLAQVVEGTGDEEDEEEEFASDDIETVGRAVLCADDPARPDLDELVTVLAGLNEVSDLFAEADVALAASCIGWPASIDPVTPITTTVAPASLVIGGSTDANTPIEWAQAMAEAIGGVYLASDHDGHTSVFNGESRCVDDVVLAFLIDGTLPAQASCAADDDGGRGR